MGCMGWGACMLEKPVRAHTTNTTLHYYIKDESTMVQNPRSRHMQSVLWLHDALSKCSLLS